jgi:hypothetical protein
MLASVGRLAFTTKAPRTTNGIGIDPGDEIAAAISDCATNLNDRRSAISDPPGLQRPNRDAQQIGGTLLPEEGIRVPGDDIQRHLSLHQ